MQQSAHPHTVHTCMHTHVRAHTHAHTRARTHACTHTCMHTPTHHYIQGGSEECAIHEVALSASHCFPHQMTMEAILTVTFTGSHCRLCVNTLYTPTHTTCGLRAPYNTHTLTIPARHKVSHTPVHSRISLPAAVKAAMQVLATSKELPGTCLLWGALTQKSYKTIEANRKAPSNHTWHRSPVQEHCIEPLAQIQHTSMS